MGVAREVCYKNGMADLEISQQGSVLVLTLNRPEARNALSEAMVNDLESALRDVEAGRYGRWCSQEPAARFARAAMCVA